MHSYNWQKACGAIYMTKNFRISQKHGEYNKNNMAKRGLLQVEG